MTIKKNSAVIETCKRPLFDFHLEEIDRIAPWGEPDNPNLSWFGFTDGFYRIDVGNDYLFNYSDSVTQELNRKHLKYGSYVNYYVVGLWENILEILPAILEPVPAEFSSIMEQPFKWLNKAKKWLHNQEGDEDEDWDIYYTASGWVGNRFIDNGHLNPSAKICFWLSEDRIMNIFWDNRGIKFKNIANCWSAQNGIFRITEDEFLKQVRLFNDTFMGKMKERIEYVANNWDNPKIKICYEDLLYNHHFRSTWSSNALNYPIKKTNFNDVLKAIDKMGIGLKI